MDYREQQRSRLVRVCGLQKLTQKLELRLNLEVVDVCSRFEINCIRARACIRVSVVAQLFLNCALNVTVMVGGIVGVVYFLALNCNRKRWSAAGQSVTI